MITAAIAALLAGAVARRWRRSRVKHRPRAIELVIAPPQPRCCSWCCPSGHFRGTMPPGYGSRCRCTGCSGHPARERGAPFPDPAPWEVGALLDSIERDLSAPLEVGAYVQPPRRLPAPTGMPGPGEKRS